MLTKWLDPYELKARIVPGLILVLPVIISALYSAPVLNNWPIFTVSGLIGFALVYALGLLARALGSRAQKTLWSSWGGPPSTRIVRHRDTFFGDALKRLLYQSVATEFSRTLPSPEDEEQNPELVDKEINDVYKQVRGYLRDKDPNGLWQTHNIEYGFYRNLLGSRVPWVLLSAGATIFSAVHGIKTGAGPANPASALDLFSVFCALYVGWVILPDATRVAADQYAESAWLAFLRKAQESR